MQEEQVSYQNLVKQYQLKVSALTNEVVIANAKYAQLKEESQNWEQQVQDMAIQLEQLQSELDSLKNNNEGEF